MQILETSPLGLRAAHTVFVSRDSSVSVTLYPMVHVGEDQFYRQVFEKAFFSDVVLTEGLRSSVNRNLTRSYRWLDFRKLRLVRQPRTPTQENVPARIVLADLAPEEFHHEWRKIPLWIRLFVAVLAPLYGIYLRYFASRERLAENMSLEDRKSAAEILGWSGEVESLENALLHSRDKRLVECLARELDSSSGETKQIAVVYGAQHMRAVLRELSRRGFYSAGSTWHTIFALTD
ncbi:hypothetical protein [Mesorhizobium sp. CAU 1732]|uniref:hypothetical protein n=1 Tax=Mesorhizobium sp. CAU 1732 TaxID=3140358 RepID=UPI003260DDDF